jgi:diguanylate cyclase (GGDEF)-like protein/PAS domain S-box-containing protein
MMTKEDTQNTMSNDQIIEPVQSLRRRAETIANKKGNISLCGSEGLKLDQSQKLLHELQVHQIELTMQNEELRKIQAELEESRARYFDLYDLAPVGYLTLNEAGFIVSSNLTAAKLIGVARSSLLNTPLKSYILSEDQDVYNKHCKRLVDSKETDDCELRMIDHDGQVFWAHLKANTITDETDNQTCRLVITDITERKKAVEELRHLSFHDQLTGLFNRYYMQTEISRLDTARQLPIGVLLADVNCLKLTNDTYGHETGDALLVKAAHILKEVCREEDIIARWGGDEFVLLLPQITDEILMDISQRIKSLCSETMVRDIQVSIAVGTAIKSEPTESLLEVFRKAEDEMYRRKMVESKNTKNAVLGTLIEALAAKSVEDSEHTRNMQHMAFKIGEKCELPDSELIRLNLLITIRDIGNINIPEQLLKNSKPLSNDEWGILKKHPEIGYRMAHATEEFAHVADDILSHHECWNGSGYPRGLQNKEIPLLVRIVTVVDAYETMRNGRPHKPQMAEDDIITELKKCSGTQFDPEIAGILLEILAGESSI